MTIERYNQMMETVPGVGVVSVNVFGDTRYDFFEDLPNSPGIDRALEQYPVALMIGAIRSYEIHDNHTVLKEKLATVWPYEQAEPIVNKWVSEAVDRIEAETGTKVDADDIMTQIADCEWIYAGGYVDDIDYIDMKLLKQQIEYIIANEIKLIHDERMDY